MRENLVYSVIGVAGIFKRSKKSETGALESRAGFKGLCPSVVAKAIDVLKKSSDSEMLK